MPFFTRCRPQSRKAAVSQTPPRTRLGVQQLEARDNPSWLAQIGSSDGEIIQFGHSRDVAGNSYLAGTFSGTFDFDPSAAVVARTAAASSNTFVAKYDPAGNLAWVRQFSFSAIANGTNVTLGAGDTPYFYGGYSGTADFGGGNIATSEGNFGAPFVLRIDPSDGATVWARTAHSTGFGAKDLAVGADGCLYATGYFHNTADFDLTTTYADNRDVLVAPGTTRNSLPSNAYIWKLDGANGAFRAAWQIGGTGGEYGEGIEVDVDAAGTGSIYLSGQFGNSSGVYTTDLDPGPGTLTRTTVGAQDIFFAKYNLTGTTLTAEWGASVGSQIGEIGYHLSADDQYLYLTGQFSSPIDFDPSAGQTILTPVGVGDVVVAKYRKSDGGLVWARPIGGPGAENVHGPVVIDPVGGAVYVGGRFEQTIDFDPGVTHPDGRDVQTARGSYDGYILKLDAASGGYQNVWRLGGTGGESVYVAGVTHTAAGPRVHVAGRFNSPTADFPVGRVLQNPDGKYDAYLMAFDEAVAPATPPVVSVAGGSVAEGNSGLVALTFTVFLSWASAEPVTVTYSTGGGTATAGTAYVAASGSVTFAPGETVKTITVWVIADTTNESSETFDLYLFDPSGDLLATAIGTITNDDASGGGKRK